MFELLIKKILSILKCYHFHKIYFNSHMRLSLDSIISIKYIIYYKKYIYIINEMKISC